MEPWPALIVRSRTRFSWLRVLLVGGIGGLVAGGVFGGFLTAPADPSVEYAGADVEVGVIFGAPLGALVGLGLILIASLVFLLLRRPADWQNQGQLAVVARTRAWVAAALVQGVLAASVGRAEAVRDTDLPWPVWGGAAIVAAVVAAVLFRNFALIITHQSESEFQRSSNR